MKIRGKEYVEVSERVQIFRRDYPAHRLDTSVLFKEPGYVMMKTVVSDPEGNIISTGIAEEVRGEPMLPNGRENINYDNYVEIAETSSVGRALGFLGIGINGGIASADEVSNAVEKREARSDDVNTQVESNNVRPKRVEKFTGREPNDIWNNSRGVAALQFGDDLINYSLKYNKADKSFFWVIVDKSLLVQGLPETINTELVIEKL